MATPQMTVRFANNSGGKKACGASLRLFSQNGNAIKHTKPMTSMAIMLGLLKPPFALNPKVRGKSRSARKVASSMRPKMSSCSQRYLTMPKGDLPLSGFVGYLPDRLAFFWLMKSETASGMKQTGRIIAHMPYPQRHDEFARTLAAIGPPAQTVQRNGRSKIVENKARFKRSVVSATKICCKTCRPWLPAE